ncbi:MAG: DUF3341 domain-containing protein [Acidobacteria bacterium]|nr:DUF3341 domain-containing protein [Acidobacteriota bacterium]
MPPTDSVLAAPLGSRKRIHTMTFDAPETALAAVRRLRSEGFEIDDVHTPYAVHGMDEALGLPETRLGWVTLAGGFIGGAVALSFQIWTHAIDWPLVIGGKSPLALPAKIPVAFELTVLFAALSTVASLLLRRRLYPSFSPEPANQPSPSVTDDRFVLLVVERDAGFRPQRFHELARELGAVGVVEGWRVL